MPTKEIIQFSNPSNVELLDEIRGTLSVDYQHRVPSATKAGLNATLNAMSSWTPAANQFLDQLINVLGSQLVRSNSWDNPLGRYKQGLLGMQESIQEVALGLLKAHTYNPEKEYLEKDLFGRYAQNVQTAYHTVNRREYYGLTVNESQLEMAFLNEGGLSRFLTESIGSLNTSDNVDEFEQMISVFRRFYDREGFFKIKTADIARASSDANDAKQFLRDVRTIGDTLPFMSTLYNPRHMPRSAQKSELIVITTPSAKAAMDVNALAGAFNMASMEIESRMVVFPESKINIPDFQAIITTENFFMFGDKLMRFNTIPNGVGLYNNYVWHHHEIISASPFEPAILLSSTEETPIVINEYVVTSVGSFTVADLLVDTDPDVPVTAGAITLNRGGAYQLDVSAITSPTGGPDDAVALSIAGSQSPRTHLNQSGILVLGQDDSAQTIIVTATSTADITKTGTLTITLEGALVTGSVGLSVDDDGDLSTPNAITA